jgi:hypothetical protein
MIKEILNLLMLDNHYGQSETIEIAKGKFKKPSNISEAINQIKRQWHKLR